MHRQSKNVGMVHDVTLHDIYHALGMKNGDVFKKCVLVL